MTKENKPTARYIPQLQIQMHFLRKKKGIFEVAHPHFEENVIVYISYVPSQCSVVICEARKQDTPYKVDETCTNDILDFKKLVSYIGNNFTENDEKEKVDWKKVKIIRVVKDHSFTLFYKTS